MLFLILRASHQLFELLPKVSEKNKISKKQIEIKPEKEPKKKGRPIVAWRHGEDGKYHSSSADPTYSTRYWQEHYRKPFECTICGKILQCCGSGVHKHQRGMHCQLAKLKKQLATAN